MNLLNTEKPFRQLFIPFFGPYALYVAIGAMPDTLVPPEIKQVLKLIIVSAVMAWFFKMYSFGRLNPKNAGIAVIATPIAILLWVVPLYFIKGQSGAEGHFSTAYFILRLINSTFLVAVFEELFIRVYMMQWFFQAGHRIKEKGIVSAVLDTFHDKPSISGLPLSWFSVALTTILFAVGHSTEAWVSAIFYFSFTNYIYKRTGAIGVCILIHGISNFVIALLVKFGGMGFLWI